MKTFIEFLQSTDIGHFETGEASHKSGLYIGYYMKGMEFAHALDSRKSDLLSNNNVSVMPLYYGKVSVYEDVRLSDISSIHRLPEKTKLVGYWLPENNTLLLLSEYSIMSNGYKEGLYSISITDIPKVMYDMRQQVKKGLSEWIDSDAKDITPSGDFSMEQADEMYCCGFSTIDMKKAHSDISAEIYDVIAQSEKLDPIAMICGDNTTVEKLLEYVKGIAEKKIAVMLGIKKYLEERTAGETDNDSFYARSRKVRGILMSLAGQGIKTCSVVFDFGYARTEQKISTDASTGNVAWLGGSRKATNQFIADYCQPITMRYWMVSGENFYPYITSITSKGKEIYHADSVENNPANELYNYIIHMGEIRRYGLSSSMQHFYQRMSKPFAELFAGKEFDLSMPPKLPYGMETDILKLYVNRYNYTLENVQYLVEHGAYVDTQYWKKFDDSYNSNNVADYMKSVIASMESNS